MAIVEATCPYCHETKWVIKQGKGHAGHPRFFCQSCSRTFQRNDADKRCYDGVHETVVNRAMNGSGMRNTARVLERSATMVIHILKNFSRNRGTQDPAVKGRTALICEAGEP